MSNLRFVALASAAVLLLSGCNVLGMGACNNPVDQKLNYGVLSYEEGNYQASVTALQGVMETGLSSKADQVRAYKYLAFIHCVSSREKMCRDYFKKALEIDPRFDLEPAESGHPIWGPVFRNVKNRPAQLTRAPINIH
jgi:Tfp pilus assembly protein PilF